jgi:hypothetical protein
MPLSNHFPHDPIHCTLKKIVTRINITSFPLHKTSTEFVFTKYSPVERILPKVLPFIYHTHPSISLNKEITHSRKPMPKSDSATRS